jgi:hypothetical protein
VHWKKKNKYIYIYIYIWKKYHICKKVKGQLRAWQAITFIKLRKLMLIAIKVYSS